MSLRPIDLQVVINQMAEVGKREKKKIDKYKSNEAEKGQKIIKESTEENDKQINVDKVEVTEEARAQHKDDQQKKKKRRGHQAEGDGEKDKVSITSEYKANFLDIRE